MNKEVIDHIIKESVESLKYILLEYNISYGKNKDTLKIIIHHNERNITSDDCTLVADIVSRKMDIEDPFERAYDLIVESPGLDRLLKSQEEYNYFIGKELQTFLIENSSILTKEGFLIGLLKEVSNDQILLDIDGVVQEIPFSLIKKSKLYYDFNNLLKKDK